MILLLKNDEFCIKNEDLCIKKDDSSIEKWCILQVLTTIYRADEGSLEFTLDGACLMLSALYTHAGD